MKFIFLIAILVSFLSCKKKNGREILYYKNGNIKSISIYTNGLKNGEQLNFFEDNGSLRSKLNFVNDVANGKAIYFYKTGCVQSVREYKDDKEYKFGIDYWDSSRWVTKSILHFNSNGNIYYKLNYDSNARFIGEEGKKDSSSFYYH